jgi:hypothetical protein
MFYWMVHLVFGNWPCGWYHCALHVTTGWWRTRTMDSVIKRLHFECTQVSYQRVRRLYLPGSIISITPKEIRSVRVSMRGKGARQAGRFQQSAPGSRHANTAIARNRWFGPRLARRIDRSISVVRADQTDSGRGQRGSSVLQSPPIHPPLSQASALHSLVVPIRGSRRREEVRALLWSAAAARWVPSRWVTARVRTRLLPIPMSQLL